MIQKDLENLLHKMSQLSLAFPVMLTGDFSAVLGLSKQDIVGKVSPYLHER